MPAPSPAESRNLLAHTGAEGWWFRAKEDIVAAYLAPHLRDGAEVVVVGVGGGGTVRRLRATVPGCRITGIDIDGDALEHCRRLDPSGSYRHGDLETDPIGPEGSADVVVALDVIEHVAADADVARRLHDVLRPGGVVAVNVPAHPALYSEHDVALGHVRRYRPAEIERLLAGAGFEILHATPLFALTLVLVVGWRKVVRRVIRPGGDNSDGDGDGSGGGSDVALRLPAPAEALLYRVAAAEGALSRRRRLPFGSSHFVLARRPACSGTDLE